MADKQMSGRREGASDMSRSYLNLGLPPTASNLTVLRTAIRRLHPDTMAVRSFRDARKRYYRELLLAHAKARREAGLSKEGEAGGPPEAELGTEEGLPPSATEDSQ